MILIWKGGYNMYSNETLKNLQDAIVNGKKVLPKDRDEIINNILWGFDSFIEPNNGGNAVVFAHSEYTPNSVIVWFQEEDNPWMWGYGEEVVAEKPHFSSSKIEIPYDQISNMKEIIANVLKQEKDFFGDNYISLSSDAIPEGIARKRYTSWISGEDERSSIIETWTDVTNHPDTYAKLLVDNYIEAFNLMNDEKFNAEDKKALFVKLDLCNHHFANEIKEILDERFPDMQKDGITPQENEMLK